MNDAAEQQIFADMAAIIRNYVILPPDDGDKPQLHVDKVVNAIFAWPGKKFTFVFKQNLRRTNMQIAELVALSRYYTTDDVGNPVGLRLDFMNFEEVKASIHEISEHLDLGDDREISLLAKKIEHICTSTALIECYYGTASIFLPEGLNIDLCRICGESGYIHSCGELLLLRNAEKTSIEEFHRAIREAISLAVHEDDRFMLIPFCHEDFSLKGRKDPFAQHGLDDIKLHISKAYVEGKHLYEVMDQVRATYEKVTVAPTNFATSSQHFARTFPNMRFNSIWLIGDSDATFGSRFPGNKKFYIMYLQRYKNNNIYHIYDENKPGWASHTTLPHSLAGAMLSISRPWMKRQGSSVIDPFGGSGTTILEAQKIGGLFCKTRDLAAITAYTIPDNVNFFKLDRSELKAILDRLTEFQGLKLEPDLIDIERLPDEGPQELLDRTFDIVRVWYQLCGGDFLRLDSEQLEAGFKSVIGTEAPAEPEYLVERLIVYVALRASVRGAPDLYRRKEASWLSFFQRELEELTDQIRRHMGWLPDGLLDAAGSRLRLGTSMYSPTTVPCPPEIGSRDLFGITDYEVKDVRELEYDKYDAVITDPPYGFNTIEGNWDASDFVDILVPALVMTLKLSGGQLILAAPDISYSGRRIIPFVRASYLIRSIIRYCSANGRECFTPAMALPGTLRSLRPPYYWVAEKTLQRKILHFWIRATSEEKKLVPRQPNLARPDTALRIARL